MKKEPFVLLLGYRKLAAQALKDMGIRYGLWHDRTVVNSAAEFIVKAPFHTDSEKLAEVIAEHKVLRRNFDFVVAPIERTVFAASRLRRMVGARISKDTIIQRCSDKFAMKKYLRTVEIPMTDFYLPMPGMDLNELVKMFGLPLVLKLRKSSGSRDVRVATTKKELAEIYEGFSNRNYQTIAERYIPTADEYSVESFVVDGEIVFTNVTEYYQKQFVNLLPGGEGALVGKLKELNEKIIKSLHIKWGMTHVEFYATDGGVLFGEIAIRPPGGHIMELLSLAYEFDAWKAFCAVEVNQEFRFPEKPLCLALGTLIHPGEGVVATIEGWNQIKQHPATREYSLKLKEGQNVKVRTGVGEECGYFLQTAKDRAEAIRLVKGVNAQLKIKMNPVHP